MTDADLVPFTAALAELKSMKPGSALTKEQFKAWWNQMRENWTIADFQAGCRKLADDVDFMPNPFHFAQLRKVGRPTSGEAWAVVLASARSGDERPDISPAAQRALAAIGGIRAVMMSDPQKTPFLAKSFGEHFEAMQDADDIRKAVPQIANPDAKGRLPGPQSIAAGLGRVLTAQERNGCLDAPQVEPAGTDTPRARARGIATKGTA